MADFQARMAGLRARFLVQAARETDELTAHAQAQRWDVMRDICHGLAGRAGLFGFAALGDAARHVEEAIEDGRHGAALQPLIERLTAELKALPPG